MIIISMKTVNSSEILLEFCIENKVLEDKILFSIQFLFITFLKITRIDEFLFKMHNRLIKIDNLENFQLSSQLESSFSLIFSIFN